MDFAAEDRDVPSQTGAQRVMKDLLILGAFLLGWFLLQTVILPKLGIST